MHPFNVHFGSKRVILAPCLQLPVRPQERTSHRFPGLFSALSKYAIENFAQIAQATAEENKATAQGTITYFGTYSVSEADCTIAIHIEASSFPNRNGADQRRFFAITGGQLKLTVRPPTGGSVDVVWRRAE